MKVIGVLLLVALAGCSSYQTLEELEQEAFATGDWSEVEQRERILAKRARRNEPVCPSGTVSYCESWGGLDRCACVSTDAMEAVFAGGY